MGRADCTQSKLRLHGLIQTLNQRHTPADPCRTVTGKPCDLFLVHPVLILQTAYNESFFVVYQCAAVFIIGQDHGLAHTLADLKDPAHQMFHGQLFRCVIPFKPIDQLVSFLRFPGHHRLQLTHPLKRLLHPFDLGGIQQPVNR